MEIEVFVQNGAGSDVKHVHDERSLELVGTQRVSRAYPYPYGFVPETAAADDCCVDAFVITQRACATGERVACRVVGLLGDWRLPVPPR